MIRNYMKIRTASKYADMSGRTLRDLIRMGHLPAIKPAVGPILLKKEDIDRYLDSCRNPDIETTANAILAELRG